MKEIGDISAIESTLLDQLGGVFSQFRLAGQTSFGNLDQGLDILKGVRSNVYEDMNQLQHEALVLRTAKYLQSNVYPDIRIKWFWNPRQTGNASEPDLQGRDKGDVVVSVEVTTSLMPKGAIDKRMINTLEKLSAMTGDKYYIVMTEEMEKRAKAKLENLGYDIQVVRLSTITKSG